MNVRGQKNETFKRKKENNKEEAVVELNMSY